MPWTILRYFSLLSSLAAPRRGWKSPEIGSDGAVESRFVMSRVVWHDNLHLILHRRAKVPKGLAQLTRILKRIVSNKKNIEKQTYYPFLPRPAFDMTVRCMATSVIRPRCVGLCVGLCACLVQLVVVASFCLRARACSARTRSRGQSLSSFVLSPLSFSLTFHEFRASVTGLFGSANLS